MNDLEFNKTKKNIFRVIPVVHYSVKNEPKFLEAQNNITNMLNKILKISSYLHIHRHKFRVCVNVIITFLHAQKAYSCSDITKILNPYKALFTAALTTSRHYGLLKPY